MFGKWEVRELVYQINFPPFSARFDKRTKERKLIFGIFGIQSCQSHRHGGKRGYGYRVWVPGMGTGYRVPGSGYRVPGTGYRVPGTGYVLYVFCILPNNFKAKRSR